MRKRTCLLMLLLALALPVEAQAHPLGNFTVNRFSALEVGTDQVAVRYAIDMAEIPTFQEMGQIDQNGDRTADREELAQYAIKKARLVQGGLTLQVDSGPLGLQLRDSSASLSPGQGGLEVLRFDATFMAMLPSGTTALGFQDINYVSLQGWKEIIAFPVDGQGFRDSTVPSTSISDELRAYPKDLLSDPPEVSIAKIILEPGAGGVPSSPELETEGGSLPGEVFGSQFAALVERELSVLSVAVALLLAVGFGALHALGPGHGKTVMAAYLLGAGGRARHAFIIGIAVSLMHTMSVIALGLATLWLAHLFSPEAVLPWLALLSGMVVVAVGVWLFRLRFRARRHVADGPSSKSAPASVDEHRAAHAMGRHHHHHLPEASPLSAKGLVAIALSGGLLPSPTALVVLLGAIALHRVAFGIALVAAFSVGLAAALAFLGLLVLRARSFASDRWGIEEGSLLPLLSSAAIVAIGAVLTTRAALTIW